MAQCRIPRDEAISILQELKSRGFIGGNAKDGYWLTPKETTDEEVVSYMEDIIDKTYSYLKVNKDTSLSNIARDLNLSKLTVKKVLGELEKRGKIKLHD
jgi:Mn-dependent DtxR family transcriptional regulator